MPPVVTTTEVTITTEGRLFPVLQEDPATSRVFLRAEGILEKWVFGLGQGGWMLVESIESTPFWIPQE
jgi:hypothetical protein